MIKLHVTKKLLAKLQIDDQGYLLGHLKANPRKEDYDGTESLLSGWHANLVTVQRKNCVFLIHDETRFPVFIPGLLKADLKDLDYFFDDCFMNTLLKCGATNEQLETASSHILLLQIDAQTDRSVQATMNHMIQEIEYMIWYEQVNVVDITGYRVGAKLADRPCSVGKQKEFKWPKRDMLALLDRLGKHP